MKSINDVVVALRRLVAEGASRRDLAATATMEGLGFSGCYTNGMGMPMLEDMHPGLKPMGEAGRGFSRMSGKGVDVAEISSRDEAALAGLVDKYGAQAVASMAKKIEGGAKEPDTEAPLEMSAADEAMLKRSGSDPKVIARMSDRTTYRDFQKIKREAKGGAA